MGTNFYIGTSSKKARDKYMGWDYELTDIPTWLYEQHIAKTSMGWLPLFEKSRAVQSVADIKKLYDTGDFVIYDEYGETYTWEQFEERVLKFNGGIAGAIPREYIERDEDSYFYDKDMPNWIPVSHFDYGGGKYNYMYFKDSEGYEFTESSFS